MSKDPLLNYIKNEYKEINYDIDDKYFNLIKEYIKGIIKLDNLYVNYFDLIKKLPEVLTKVEEKPVKELYGKSFNKTITLSTYNNEKENIIYFFHELTHALQSRYKNEIELCGFYNGETGMFITEASTQYIAEILYAVYKNERVTLKEHTNIIKNNNIVSTLEEYALNGNILMMLSLALNIPLNEILAYSFKEEGRTFLKNEYNKIPEMEESFEYLMYDLEKIYLIDKVSSLKNNMDSEYPKPIKIPNTDIVFYGNYTIQEELVEKVQKELILAYILNNDVNYILNNYGDFLSYLTTKYLQTKFLATIRHITKNINTYTK